MASNQETLIVELQGKVDQYNQNMGSALRNTKSGSKDAADGLKRVEKNAVSLNEMGSKALMRFAGLAIAAFSTDKILEYADAYTNLQNRIRTVIKPTEDLNIVTEDLLRIANDSWATLETTSVLYSRLSRNTRELGINQDELLKITGTINKAFSISGATIQESSGAIRQLSQAFASGVLRGDEFNSVAEQAPVIMEAIKLSTGKTAGELRELAADGKISAEILVKSLQAYSDTIDADFAKAQMTAGQATEILNNNFTVFVGELDKAVGLSSGVSTNIQDLAASIGTMQPVLLEAVELFKDFSGVVRNSLEGQGDDVRALVETYDKELQFLGDLIKSFAFIVETGMLAVPVAIQSALTVTIAGMMQFIDEGRKQILEFRLFLNELTGDDTTASLIQKQIDEIGSGASDTMDMVVEAATQRLSNLGNAVAENDAAMLAERTKRIDEQNEKELQQLKEKLETEAKLKSEFEAAGGGNLALDGETSSDKAKRLAKEEKDRLKQEQKDRDAADKADKKRDSVALRDKTRSTNELMRMGQSLARHDEAIGKQALNFITQKASTSIMAYAAEGAQKAISQLGVFGIPVAGAILAGGAALSNKVSSLVMGDSGSAGSAPGGASLAQGPEINTAELPSETSTLDVSLAGDTGTSSRQIVIMAPPGDSLGSMMADWLNDSIKKGRIG
jgi:tape measure domain-containing protein